jgi:hypothetical protein
MPCVRPTYFREWGTVASPYYNEFRWIYLRKGMKRALHIFAFRVDCRLLRRKSHVACVAYRELLNPARCGSDCIAGQNRQH